MKLKKNLGCLPFILLVSYAVKGWYDLYAFRKAYTDVLEEIYQYTEERYAMQDGYLTLSSSEKNDLEKALDDCKTSPEESPWHEIDHHFSIFGPLDSINSRISCAQNKIN